MHLSGPVFTVMRAFEQNIMRALKKVLEGSEKVSRKSAKERLLNVSMHSSDNAQSIFQITSNHIQSCRPYLARTSRANG